MSPIKLPRSSTQTPDLRAGPIPSGILGYLGATWTDLRHIAAASFRLAGRWWIVLTGALVAVLLAALALRPNEMALLAAIQQGGDGSLRAIAKSISFWGDIYTGTAIVVVLTWLAGLVSRRASWRAAAVAILVAAVAAGCFTDIFRFGLGRARPNAGVPDGFYWFQTRARFHGFPSGHTTTAFATAMPIAILCPPLTLPGLVAAGTVGWSRMYLNQHRPTDVLVGAGVGCIFGAVVGAAARRRIRHG